MNDATISSHRDRAWLLLAAAAFSGMAAVQASVEVLAGDHHVTADPLESEAGNLDVDGVLSAYGGLDFGVAPGDVAAVALSYMGTSTKTVTIDATENGATFLWRDNNAATAEAKLQLDGLNLLSLFKSDGSAIGLTLNPNASSITFTGTDGGLLHSSGGSILRFGAMGSPVFDKQPQFTQGIDFGSGGTLDAGKMGYLQGMLTGFGYQQDLNATPVVKLDLAGDIEITDIEGEYYIGHYKGSARINNLALPASEGKRSGFWIHANSSTGVVSLVKSYTGTDSILPTCFAQGDYFTVVGGHFSGTTTSFPGGMNATSAGSTDGFIHFYYSEEDQSMVPVAASGADSVTSVAALRDGPQEDYFAIGGYFTGTASANPVNAVYGLTAASQDGFVVCYDTSLSDQSRIFRYRIGSTGMDAVTSLAESPYSLSLGVGGYIGGNTSSLPSGKNLTSAGGRDGFALKIDNSTYAVAWAKPVGGTGSDQVLSLAMDPSGNLYAAGEFQGTTTNLASGMNLSSIGGTDGFAVRMSAADGSTAWSRKIGSTANDLLASVDLDAAGDLLAGGSYGATISSGLPASYPSAGFADAIIAKIDGASGTVEAVQTIGSAGFDSVGRVDFSGGVNRIAGRIQGKVPFGDTLLVPASSSGMIAMQWAGFAVSTPVLQSPSALQWGGAFAEGSASVALGSTSYSSGVNSFAATGGLSTGTGSTAVGTGTKATGHHSTAMGNGSQATGEASTAFGIANAWGNYSMAGGNGTVAAGTSSTAFGEAAEATGYGSTSFGILSVASGEAATAAGIDAAARGYASVSLGGFVAAEGDYSFATGYQTMALGMYSTVSGKETFADGDASAAFGVGSMSEAYAAFAVGAYNLGGGDGQAWQNEDPVFEIGNGDSGQARSNAMTMLKNGRTTLTNKAWKENTADPLGDPAAADDSGGEALVVEGHVRMKGKVVLEERQGDISMGIYE